MVVRLGTRVSSCSGTEAATASTIPEVNSILSTTSKLSVRFKIFMVSLSPWCFSIL